MPKITALGIVPVKGMRWTPAEALELGPGGALGDRAFFVVGADGALLSTERTPALNRVLPVWQDPVLTLEFPDGRAAGGTLEAGEATVVTMYDGRRVPGHRMTGGPVTALGQYLGQVVDLVARDPEHYGADDAPVSLMSEASVAALAAELDGAVPDPRRFRMNVTADGFAAWGEDEWRGRDVRIGGAVVRFDDPIGRCVVTTRDPETAERDLPVLKAIATLRGKQHVDLGVWCQVVTPGRIAVGDELLPLG